MTALAIGSQPRQSPMTGIDTAIRVSTAGAVLVNAAVAAYISYWHAYAVVHAHGATGITARLEPATIDGLVYASSMVILYAARHGHRVPGLARWFLAAGILATLAANMAQGLSSGPVGAVIAAWPAVSLTGSYELLVWMIRTAAAGGPGRGPEPDRAGRAADHPAGEAVVTRLPAGTPDNHEVLAGVVPARRHAAVRPAGPAPGQWSGPDRTTIADRVDQDADRLAGTGPASTSESGIVAAAVDAYLASLRAGSPMSERKLAGMFGKTSRRWARNRMAEARQSLAAA